MEKLRLHAVSTTLSVAATTMSLGSLLAQGSVTPDGQQGMAALRVYSIYDD